MSAIVNQPSVASLPLLPPTSSTSTRKAPASAPSEIRPTDTMLSLPLPFTPSLSLFDTTVASVEELPSEADVVEARGLPADLHRAVRAVVRAVDVARAGLVVPRDGGAGPDTGAAADLAGLAAHVGHAQRALRDVDAEDLAVDDVRAEDLQVAYRRGGRWTRGDRSYGDGSRRASGEAPDLGDATTGLRA